jgi:DNA integrity scanning protein DisA with diadenylate cyclase activity
MVIVFIFKSELRTLLKRVARVASVTVKDVSLKFLDEVAELQAAVDAEKENLTDVSESPHAPIPAQIESLPWLDTAKKIAESSSTAAILYAWTVVDQEMRATLKKLGVSSGEFQRHTITSATRVLSEQTDIGSKTVELIMAMQKVRNAVAHLPPEEISEDPTIVEVFLDGVETIMSFLPQLKLKS